MLELTEQKHPLISQEDIRKLLLSQYLNDIDRRTLAQINKPFSHFFTQATVIKEQLIGNIEHLCQQCDFHYNDDDKILLNEVSNTHFNLLITLTTFFPISHVIHEKRINFFKWVVQNQHHFIDIKNNAFYRVTFQIAIVYIGLEIPDNQELFEELLQGYENKTNELVHFIAQHNILNIIHRKITIDEIKHRKSNPYQKIDKSIRFASNIFKFEKFIFEQLNKFQQVSLKNPIIQYLTITLNDAMLWCFSLENKGKAQHFVNIENLRKFFPVQMDIFAYFLLNRISQNETSDIYSACESHTKNQSILGSIKKYLADVGVSKNQILSEFSKQPNDVPLQYFLYDHKSYRQAEKLFIQYINRTEEEVAQVYNNIRGNNYYTFSYRSLFFQLKHLNLGQYDEIYKMFFYGNKNQFASTWPEVYDEFDKLNQLDMRKLLKIYPTWEMMLLLQTNQERNYSPLVINGFNTLIKRGIQNLELISDALRACMDFEKFAQKKIDRKKFVPFYLSIYFNNFCHLIYGESFSNLLKLLAATKIDLLELAAYCEQDSTVNFW